MHPAERIIFAMFHQRSDSVSLFVGRVLLCCVLICVSATPAHGVLPPTWRNGRQGEPLHVVEMYRMVAGDSLLGVLHHNGVGRTEAHAVARALKTYLNPRKLRIGTRLELHLKRTDPGACPSLAELRVPDSHDRLVTLLRVDESSYSAECSVGRGTAQLRRCVFTIGMDLETSAVEKGVALPVLRKAETLLKKEVDLHKDVAAGDTFAIVWEEYDYGPKAQDSLTGELLACALQTRSKSIKLFRFANKTGAAGYYDARGWRVSKPLAVMPIPHAEITSKFGMREHPVLGGHRMHKGIDVKATMGTPVHAASDGVVIRKGWGGGYGRIVALKHPTGLETRYAHLSRFAGLRMGQKVAKGDVIGFVGATGRVTGPHLHFEVLRGGTQVNPLNFNLEETVRLSADERQAFEVIRRRLEKALALQGSKSGESEEPAAKASWKISG